MVKYYVSQCNSSPRTSDVGGNVSRGTIPTNAIGGIRRLERLKPAYTKIYGSIYLELHITLLSQIFSEVLLLSIGTTFNYCR